MNLTIIIYSVQYIFNLFGYVIFIDRQPSLENENLGTHNSDNQT